MSFLVLLVNFFVVYSRGIVHGTILVFCMCSVYVFMLFLVVCLKVIVFSVVLYSEFCPTCIDLLDVCSLLL